MQGKFKRKVITMKKKITKNMKTFWGVAEIGEGFFSSVVGLYFTFYLTDIAKLPLAYVSFIMMFTSVADFIISPLSGGLIEAVKPMKWGKLRSWLLILPPIVAITNALKFVNIGNALTATIVIIVAYMINTVGFNTMVAANYALVPSMCAYEDERSHLSSNRMTGSNIGRLVMGYLAPLVMVPLIASTGDMAYAIIAFVSAALMMLGYFAHFAMAKGYEGNGSVTESSEETLSLKDMFRAIFSNPQIIPLMISDMTSTLGSFLLPSLIMYMYTYVIGDITLVAYHNLLTGIGGMLGAYSSRFFMNKFDDRRKVCLCIYPCIALCVFSTRFFVDLPWVFMGVCTVLQFLIGITQPVESTLYYDVAVYSEWKTGKDSTALIIGLTNLPIKLATIVKSVVLSALLVAVGYDASLGATPQLRSGLINAFSLVNCVIPLLGFLSLKFLYKLTPDVMAKCREEIKMRKETTEN